MPVNIGIQRSRRARSHLLDLAVMEVAFNREREERLERIVLRQRCLALPER
jgi:hypothetical protein